MVEVKIAASEDFKKGSGMWLVEMHKMVRDVSCTFKTRFDIAFKIRGVEFWRPEPCPESLPARLREMNKKVPREGGLLVIGILPAWISQGPPYGAADYLHACVLLKDHPSKAGLKNILEHELCHIFGAIDLNEKGSIMSSPRYGGRYDAFTTKIIRLNRMRSFEPGRFPLEPEVLEKAIALYEERLGQGVKATPSTDREGKELRIVLSRLHQELRRPGAPRSPLRGP